MHRIITPFVSVLDDQPDARFPVCVIQDGECECSAEGDCSAGYLYGDEDPHSPEFCSRHFHALHWGERKQSHIEPMTEQEFHLLVMVRPAESASEPFTADFARHLPPSHPTVALVQEALDAFWQVIADAHPQAKTGDLSPERTIALEQSAEKAVQEWIDSNV